MIPRSAPAHARFFQSSGRCHGLELRGAECDSRRQNASAESLTRRAFPGHPQFWRIWSRTSARSPEVLGRTVVAFLLVSVFVAYDVALYFFATRWLRWWTPSEALFNPDVLAAYTPWFSAIARSFQAGF